jgi:hypothetical protein
MGMPAGVPPLQGGLRLANKNDFSAPSKFSFIFGGEF